MAETDGRKRRFEHRRSEVLQAVTKYVLDHGIADLSLRRAAEVAGISHATLLHHFGTKEKLVTEVLETILGVALADPDIPNDDPDPLRSLWERARSSSGLRHAATFLEITIFGYREGTTVSRAVRQSVDDRIDLLAAGLIRAGCPTSRAMSLATLVLGSLRGLLVDLLATGDEERVDAAFEELHAAVTAVVRG
ncbi:TetR/AcrR family transcriptional regulator [Brevibacterium aurantiacum]|uniref:TetR/AcrR family transcriptional regulator n=1 Tax=Brevibacterium aurantiacum TaxID=273384 RepID=A0A556CPW6_BREAU|nr:TetR/AcrR family transcriptional regulator [Brevibacterium aurantiacum]TSI19467.1 TetR/AcrR family transcriptional regulator [Brevibacterium aurantiacum]